VAFRSSFPILVLAALALFVMSYSALSAASVRDRDAQTVAPAEPLPAPPLPTPEAPEPKAKPRPRPDIAIVRRSVPLRARPNGRVVARAQAQTEFGGRRALSVAARRGAWLGVVTPELPNGKLAWVHAGNRGLDLRRTAYSLHADLSGRWLELRREGRTVRRITVAIGRPGSETPTGRFAVTDKLRGTSYGPYYGCCVLALNGHQPKLPAGWQGGDRLAIHGTNSPGTIGAAASAGCLRAGDADLEVLMRRVPLGTPVFIRN
jgi:L,D-transpeptidase catalytic domain